MKKKQFDTLVIHDLEEDIFHLPTHSHTYYELVYVIKGKGKHYLNNLVMSYKAGDLFLISPKDQHYLDFATRSRMVFIKFTEQYFETNKFLSPDIFMKYNPETIMRHQLLKEEKLKFDNTSKLILKRIIENILDYNVTGDVSSSPLIFYQLFSIFGLINELTAKMNIRIDNGLPDKEDIITYLHQHIYNPDKIRIKNLASHFNISEKYFSSYFKRNFEISLRDYINEYRLALIEKRIESGKNTIKQIAYEFGFTDESHLSHYFKNKKHKTLGSYKLKGENSNTDA